MLYYNCKEVIADEQKEEKQKEPNQTNNRTANCTWNVLSRAGKSDTGSQVKARGESPKPLK
jgi:hypothetical protein